MLKKLVKHSLLFTVVLLVFLSLLPLIVANSYPPFLSDDAYITLTYAKNLASGNGFVFNHSPAVLGTTTPLFTLVISGFALIFPKAEPPVIAVFLSAFCWLGIAWIFFFFRKDWGLENWQVCILALILIGSGWVDSLGMEAYPFAFLLVLSLSLFLSRRYWLTGFISGLLFLTRGEGVLVLVVLSIALTIEHWVKRKSIDIELVQKILKLVGGFILPVLPWVIYARFTFGSFLPNTLAAKQAQGQTGMWRPFLLRLTKDWMPLWGKSFAFEEISIINFWWIIASIGFIDVILRKRKWMILAGWILLYIAGYTLLNVSGYVWYQLPILFVLNVLFGLGIFKIVELLRRYVKPHGLSLGIAVLFIIILVFVLAKPTFNDMLTNKGDARGNSYMALSEWFREHADPSNSIAYIEIGYLGYFTDCRIIDLAGLVLPDSLPHIAEGDFAWGFWKNSPDFYVYLPDFDWALARIRADSRFDQQYQPVATLRGPRAADFIIYERKGK